MIGVISIDREMLWQWDYGQRVQLHDVPVGTAVHFSNAAIKPNAFVTEAYEDGEGVYANIPNILLQTAGTLTAYIYIEDGDEGHTEYRKLFIVRDREKPDDYVYTEDDVKTWVSLEERIKVLEESGGGAAGGLIRPLSEIGEIDGVTVKHVPDKDRVELTVEMTADSMNSVFGGNAVYKNDFLNARQLQLMFRIPGAGRLFLWELFEDDLITVTNYPNKKFIMVSTNRMIVSFTYDENGQFVSETKTYQANVQQLDDAKATIPNSATVNEENELVMQRTDGDAVSELFKVALPQGGGSTDIPDTLPNPHPLTFTGAVEATYDGSTPVEVEIPMGGSGGGETGGGFGLGIADNYDIELITEVYNIDQENMPKTIEVTQKDDGTPFAYDGLIIWTDIKDNASYSSVIFNKNGYIIGDMTHGNKNKMNLYITDGTSMRQYGGGVIPSFYLKQTIADVNNLFYPNGALSQLPEKFTAVTFGGFAAVGITGTFYKIWGLKKK